MKIGVVLEQELHSGGGFQQALNALEQLTAIAPPWLQIAVFTTAPANAGHAALAGRDLHVVPRGAAERLRSAALARTLPAALDQWCARHDVLTALERAMVAEGVDLVYFLSPSGYALALRQLPYILTVWDLCHRDHPEFPEVRAQGEFARREAFYREAINRAVLTLTDSEELNQRMAQYYGAESGRLLAMPFQPAGFARESASASTNNRVQRLGLPADYLFYPAQFWPHKNHVRILQALALRKAQGQSHAVVFCGGDKNNKPYIQRLATELGVAGQVSFIGFVPEADMQALYRHCRALVMPTYFGPTNLPPLEAWALGKPVIYSAHLAGQVGDGALCVDPDSAEELAAAIATVYDNAEATRALAARGQARLEYLGTLRRQAEATFLKKLESFNNRKLCWGK
ncbi:glycosyltransferase family 1 protein [Azospira sp. I13]|uniref:glycosyltransferase family 4 protein n=1 Tax=Azospira sp. I13 TaxID=1765050 RepID=UPI001057E64F|nr:glycosyltransferase family 1 protein [Azospira sp. I13]